MERNHAVLSVSRRALLGGVAGAAATSGLAALIAPMDVAQATTTKPRNRKVGATTPFVTIGAEHGTLTGNARVRSIAPGMPAPMIASLESEAQGYALVELNRTGDSVRIKNTTQVRANTVVVRASIPDAPAGGGITATLNMYVNGAFRQAITLSSAQAWIYRNSTTSVKDPNGGGVAHHFYNEFPVWVKGVPIAPGDTIMFRKDADNTASAYHIDCLDLESAPAPLQQPANSLSVISYGADPTFGIDSTAAIQDAVDAARARGRSVWIPAGKYMTNSVSPTPLNFAGVSVHGAGMWHTILYRNIPLPSTNAWKQSKILVGSGTTLTDIQIDSNAASRQDDGGAASGVEAFGATGWMIDRIWTRHCDANWLSGSNGTIQNCRTADSYGDGFNVNNSNVPNPDKLGYNITVRNNFARGTGDDSFAVFSDAGKVGGTSQVTRVRVVNNTAVAPWWANGIRVAGGRELEFLDNLVDSVSSNSAMDIGVFGSTGLPLESCTVSGNTLIGGGGWNGTGQHGVRISSPNSDNFYATSYTNVTFTDNIVRGSLRTGIFIDWHNDNVTLKNNTVDRPAAQGICVRSEVTGNGYLTRNTVHTRAGQVPFQNDSPATFSAHLSGNSWQHR